MPSLHDHPEDQAQGLRRLFARPSARMIPVVANPHVAFDGVVLERLCAVLAELGQHTLVVDASERAPAPAEWARGDLAAGIEPISPHVSYLAAGGLPRRFVDTQGSSAALLRALADAAPHAGVVLVHAPAPELCRLFAGRQARPLLLAHDHPDAVTHAYAALKMLALRAGLMTHDLLFAAAAQSPRAERIAGQLAHCADVYLGAVLHDWVRIDPANFAHEPPSPALRRLVHELLLACDAGAATPWSGGPKPPPASLSTRAPALTLI